MSIRKVLRDTKGSTTAVLPATLLLVSLASIAMAIVTGAIPSPKSTAPIASIVIKPGKDCIIVDHFGGDPVKREDLKVIAVDDSGNKVVLDSSKIRILGDDDDMLEVGERIIILYDELPARSGVYTVELINHGSVLSRTENVYIPPKCGDVNGDGRVNMGDVTALYYHVAYGTPINEWAGDVNGDGKIDESDVIALNNHIGFGTPLHCSPYS